MSLLDCVAAKEPKPPAPDPEDVYPLDYWGNHNRMTARQVTDVQSATKYFLSDALRRDTIALTNDLLSAREHIQKLQIDIADLQHQIKE